MKIGAFKRYMDNFINDLSLKIKLLLLFLLFSVVLVLAVGVLSYRSSSQVIDEQTVTYSQSILQQVKQRVEELRDEVLKVSIPIVINPYIQNNDILTLNITDYMNRKKSIDSELLTVTYMKKYISSIYICFESDTIISTQSVSSKDESNYKSFITYQTAIANSTKPIWVGSHDNEFELDDKKKVISFVRSLYNKETFLPFGALIINVPTAVLDNMCGVNDNYNILIADKGGNIAYKMQASNTELRMDQGYLDSICKSKNESGTLVWESNDNKYRIQYLKAKGNDWIYIAEVPEKFLMQNSTHVRNSITVILIMGIIMSITAAFIISSYFTVPLRKMIKTMKRVRKGDFAISLDIQGKSEIGQLAENYTVMVNEIKNLIEKIKIESQEKREAELNALQAQITPHFLYNTLNSIKCMARIQKVSSIEEMSSALIDLLRLSISKKTVFIRVDEEIELVRKYVIIHSFRHGNKFTIDYECEEETLGYMTIKLILQPIIENAIIHGLEPKNGHGHIKVKSYKIGNEMYFEVEDNGIGMDEVEINRIWNDEGRSDKRLSGIGIKNTNERINRYFGTGYGITFASVPGEYTKVLVRIPAIMESEVQSYV